jgi:hypothetical protein
MNDMEWAIFGIGYLKSARSSTHEVFDETMNEFRGFHGAQREPWYSECKNIIQSLYHYSLEFTGDEKIPGENFSSPSHFIERLTEYQKFVRKMVDDLDSASTMYMKKHEYDSPPFLITTVKERALYILDAVDYVVSRRPKLDTADIANTASSIANEVSVVTKLATRFHESALALKQHPHGGATFGIENEWDCQYLFRAILAAYFRDVRVEEWGPSLAGSSARCEFFIKPAKMLIELKYVRNAKDQKKIKQELLADFGDYGGNSDVEYVVALVYDPTHQLPNAVQLQTDLSGATKGLKEVHVIVSPPR